MNRKLALVLVYVFFVFLMITPFSNTGTEEYIRFVPEEPVTFVSEEPIASTPEVSEKPIDITPEVSEGPITFTPEEGDEAVTYTPEVYEEYNPSDSLSVYAHEVVRLVNLERQKQGLHPLSQDNVNLGICADIRANETMRLFSHTRPNGESCFTVLAECGVVSKTAAENIACGYSSPDSVVNGWMNSPGHRANILNGAYSDTGVGAARHSDGTLYWVQLFIG